MSTLCLGYFLVSHASWIAVLWTLITALPGPTTANLASSWPRSGELPHRSDGAAIASSTAAPSPMAIPSSSSAAVVSRGTALTWPCHFGIEGRFVAFREDSELVRLSSTCHFSLLLAPLARERVVFSSSVFGDRSRGTLGRTSGQAQRGGSVRRLPDQYSSHFISVCARTCSDLVVTRINNKEYRVGKWSGRADSEARITANKHPMFQRPWIA